MRIAVIHEWFTRWSGSEQVLERILGCLPGADLFALTCHPDAEGARRLAGRRVRTSIIQKLPFGARRPQLYLPLLPWAAGQMDLRDYDLVVSNTHCAAKGVVTRPDAVHLSYVHTPMRYAWDLESEYSRRVPWPLRPAWSWQMGRMRAWERRAAAGIDHLVANSAYVAERIRRAWGRDAAVVHPPADLAAFTPGGARQDVYVTASRLAPYKRVPVIAAAFARMPGRRLVVIGDGGDLAQVRRIAAGCGNIEVLGHVPQPVLVAHLRQALAFVFAAEEDFGLAPVEAQACGTPVIAFGRGGARETVIAGESGVFFDAQTPEAIIAAVEAFERQPAPDPSACRRSAERFGPERFDQAFRLQVGSATGLSPCPPARVADPCAL